MNEQKERREFQKYVWCFYLDFGYSYVYYLDWPAHHDDSSLILIELWIYLNQIFKHKLQCQLSTKKDQRQHKPSQTVKLNSKT